MTPITIEMYAPVVASETQPNLSVINRVRLQGTRSQMPGIMSPNEKLVVDQNIGGFSCECSGVTDAVIAGFKGGKKYYVTISETPPA